MKTNRQKDFYDSDKSDEIDVRCIAQIPLRFHGSLPKIEENSEVYVSIRETERLRETLVKLRRKI